jgi:hypothetical protein
MLIARVSLLILLALVANCYAEAQFDFGYSGQHYFRSALPASSLNDDGSKRESVENRVRINKLQLAFCFKPLLNSFSSQVFFHHTHRYNGNNDLYFHVYLINNLYNVDGCFENLLTIKGTSTSFTAGHQ